MSFARVSAEFVRLVRSWNQFWFEAEAYPQMRLFRAVFGALIFVLYLVRTPDVLLFFSESGMMPSS